MTDLPPKAVAYFELAVSLYLAAWPALTLAVTNEWGGPDSSEKRDWLAGVLADHVTDNPTKEVDVDDLEDIATQVMGDEFNVVLEDDSAVLLAREIEKSWRECMAGEYGNIEAMKARFESGLKTDTIKRDENDSESSDDEDVTENQENGEGGQGQDRMEIDRQDPIIDDDGFELVQKKRRR